MTRTALLLALAVVLPLVFHRIGMAGRVFLPMHIPALLAGGICGMWSGLLVGVLAPGLSFLITGSMPPVYAIPLMSLELAIYGFVTGFLYYRVKWNIYPSVMLSMIAGRIGFAAGLVLIGPLVGANYGLAEYFTSVMAMTLPGILIQIIVVPPLIAAITRRWSR